MWCRELRLNEDDEITHAGDGEDPPHQLRRGPERDRSAQRVQAQQDTREDTEAGRTEERHATHVDGEVPMSGVDRGVQHSGEHASRQDVHVAAHRNDDRVGEELDTEL